jgi:hypothetical protein
VIVCCFRHLLISASADTNDQDAGDSRSPMPLSKLLWPRRVFNFKHKRLALQPEFERDFLLESKASAGLSSLPLPSEVWAEIFSYAASAEERVATRICLVCRAFYWEAIRVLYRRVNLVTYPPEEIWQSMQRWSVIVTTRHRLAALVQALKIYFTDWSTQMPSSVYEQWLDTISRGFASLPNLKEYVSSFAISTIVHLEWDRLDIQQHSFPGPWIASSRDLDFLRSLPQLERLYTHAWQDNLRLILPLVISQRRLTNYHASNLSWGPWAGCEKHLQQCNDFLPNVTDLQIPFQLLEYIASNKVTRLITMVWSEEITFLRLLSRHKTTLTHLRLIRHIASESRLTISFINQLAEAAPLTEDLSLRCLTVSHMVSTFWRQICTKCQAYRFLPTSRILCL